MFRLGIGIIWDYFNTYRQSQVLRSIIGIQMESSTIMLPIIFHCDFLNCIIIRYYTPIYNYFK